MDGDEERRLKYLPSATKKSTIPRQTLHRWLREDRNPNKKLRLDNTYHEVDQPTTSTYAYAEDIDSANKAEDDVENSDVANDEKIDEEATYDNNIENCEQADVDFENSDVADNEELEEEATYDNHTTEKVTTKNVTIQQADDMFEEHVQLDKTQLLTIMLGLQTKHKLTNVCVSDICHFVNLVTGKEVMPTSYYHFKTELAKFKTPVQIHNICPYCNKNLGPNDCSETLCCCGRTVDISKNIKEGNFFMHLPLEFQLRRVLESGLLNLDHLNVEHKNNEPAGAVIRDIYDGNLYRKMVSEIKLKIPENGMFVTLNINTDGVPVFSSSNFGLWPVLCSINDLPPVIRKKHILLTSLWFGDKKPVMNEFFKPFIAELNKLSTDGFEFQIVDGVFSTCYVFCAVAVCDSVARPTLQNMIQFNGNFGCSFCLHSGQTVAKGHGTCRVYPNKQVEKRNDMEWREMAEQSVNTNSIVKGIKGPSLFFSLMFFDMVRSFVPDYMHAVLLGVVRQMYKLWFDSSYHEMPWYIGSQQSEIDKRLLHIQPPYILSRTPRSLKTNKFWKAHEWYAWLRYYSIPVLKGILNIKYLHHWSLLVNSIYTLIKRSLTKSDCFMAIRALEAVSELTQELYGLEHVSFNIHLCTHIPDSVLDWGPLWAQSAFIYENFNGILLNMVKSSNGVPHQIMNSFQNLQVLSLNSMVLPENSMFNEFFLQLQASSKLTIRHKYSSTPEQNVRLLGPEEKATIEANDRLAIISSSDKSINNDLVVTYCNRVMICNITYCSLSYKRVTKRNSCVCIVNNGEIFQVKRFLLVCDDCYAVGFYFKKSNLPAINNLPLNAPLHHIIPGEFSTSLSAVTVKNFKGLAIFLQNYNNKNGGYVCLPPNYYEVSL